MKLLLSLKVLALLAVTPAVASSKDADTGSIRGGNEDIENSDRITQRSLGTFECLFAKHYGKYKPRCVESDRLFNQNVTPDTTFGGGNVNGAFTVVKTDTLEIGIRGKTRYPVSKNPADESPGEGSQGDGTYKFPAGNDANRQLWSFDWHVNTDFPNTDGIPDILPETYTYELGLDYDPSAATQFFQFDPITPNFALPVPDHSFDNNLGSGDSGQTCNGGLFPTYVACLRSLNVIQQSWQYAFFLGSLPGFDPNVNGNYVIYLRVLDTKKGKKQTKYVVAETYIEILVGTAPKLTEPPSLPDPL